MMHLFKGNVGSGIFALGDAFKNAGLLLAPPLTIFLGIICVHAQHMLVRMNKYIKINMPTNCGVTCHWGSCLINQTLIDLIDVSPLIGFNKRQLNSGQTKTFELINNYVGGFIGTEVDIECWERAKLIIKKLF